MPFPGVYRNKIHFPHPHDYQEVLPKYPKEINVIFPGFSLNVLHSFSKLDEHTEFAIIAAHLIIGGI